MQHLNNNLQGAGETRILNPNHGYLLSFLVIWNEKWRERQIRKGREIRDRKSLQRKGELRMRGRRSRWEWRRKEHFQMRPLGLIPWRELKPPLTARERFESECLSEERPGKESRSQLNWRRTREIQTTLQTWVPKVSPRVQLRRRPFSSQTKINYF